MCPVSVIVIVMTILFVRGQRNASTASAMGMATLALTNNLIAMRGLMLVRELLVRLMMSATMGSFVMAQKNAQEDFVGAQVSMCAQRIRLFVTQA